MRRRISSGSAWEKKYGYSRVLIDRDWIFVSGVTGTDYATGIVVDGAVEQVDQAFRNLESALGQANAALSDIVQARYYISRRADVDTVLSRIGVHFTEVRPAATAVLAELIDERMRVEIEVVARKA